jgi:DegT/DnrJ/EryC1/StrS aminotransferase family
MLVDAAHQAAVADCDLLSDIDSACRWWSAQRTWRVSSSYTGGGVIATFEESVARSVARDAVSLALPSATAALVTAVRAAGIAPGSTLGVPALDWTAVRAAAASLGVRTRALPVSPETGLLDTALGGGLTDGLAGVIAVHLHGLTCDVPALHRRHPGLLIIEDAAQAWAARYPDGTAVGSASDICTFSFGAAKSPSAGELGCLVTRTADLYRAAVALTQHPARQLLAGVLAPRVDQVMTRVAPAVALLGAYAVQRHASQAPALRQAAALLVTALRDAGLTVLTDPYRHAPGVVAVSAAAEETRAALRGITLGRAFVITSVDGCDLHVHPDVRDEEVLRGLARSITTVTIAGRRNRRRPSGYSRSR